ncbi:hypothetical protein TNCV_1097531 [Trichonephila clavipes]|nr:hypothetical protein TNCV_1097531 [Trichonephila clavipes]
MTYMFAVCSTLKDKIINSSVPENPFQERYIEKDSIDSFSVHVSRLANIGGNPIVLWNDSSPILNKVVLIRLQEGGFSFQDVAERLGSNASTVHDCWEQWSRDVTNSRGTGSKLTTNLYACLVIQPIALPFMKSPKLGVFHQDNVSHHTVVVYATFSTERLHVN